MILSCPSPPYSWSSNSGTPNLVPKSGLGIHFFSLRGSASCTPNNPKLRAASVREPEPFTAGRGLQPCPKLFDLCGQRSAVFFRKKPLLNPESEDRNRSRRLPIYVEIFCPLSDGFPCRKILNITDGVANPYASNPLECGAYKFQC